MTDSEDKVLAPELPKKRGVGRPRKEEMNQLAIIADQNDPAGTLRTLGYDPLMEVIKTLKKVEKEIKWVKALSKPSQAAIASLMATKRALNADLLKYGYRTVPEKVINENHNFAFGIKLTNDKGEEVEVVKTLPIEEVDTSPLGPSIH